MKVYLEDKWKNKFPHVNFVGKAEADYLLYIITPSTSIAEVIDDTIKYPEKTLISILGCFDKDIALSPIYFNTEMIPSLLELAKSKNYIKGGFQQVGDFLSEKEDEVFFNILLKFLDGRPRIIFKASNVFTDDRPVKASREMVSFRRRLSNRIGKRCHDGKVWVLGEYEISLYGDNKPPHKYLAVRI